MALAPWKVRITADGSGTLDAVHATVELVDRASPDGLWEIPPTGNLPAGVTGYGAAVGGTTATATMDTHDIVDDSYVLATVWGNYLPGVAFPGVTLATTGMTTPVLIQELAVDGEFGSYYLKVWRARFNVGTLEASMTITHPPRVASEGAMGPALWAFPSKRYTQGAQPSPQVYDDMQFQFQASTLVRQPGASGEMSWDLSVPYVQDGETLISAGGMLRTSNNLMGFGGGGPETQTWLLDEAIEDYRFEINNSWRSSRTRAQGQSGTIRNQLGPNLNLNAAENFQVVLVGSGVRR